MKRRKSFSEDSATQLAKGAYAVAETGAIHLSSLVTPSGKFVYKYGDNGYAMSGYNLLRHCGTIWAMAEIATARPHMETVANRAQVALDWLLDNRLGPYRGGLCVIGKNKETKLGGAGLAILACVAVHKMTGRKDVLDKAEKMGQFILNTRRDDGDFDHKFSVRNDEVLEFRSDYYTGEALFALARLNSVLPRSRWTDAVTDSLEQLSARDYGVPEQSHWMAYALCEAADFAGAEMCLDYAGRIIKHTLDYPVYRSRKQSTPTACRTEALLSFLRLMDANPSLNHPLKDAAWKAAQDNLNSQFAWRLADGAFRKGDADGSVQIDYVQHNISGFFEYGERISRIS